MRFPSSVHLVLTLAAFCLTLPLPAADPDWVIALDVPAPLGGANRLPAEVVETDGATYSLLASLPPGTAIGAVDLTPGGTYLLTTTTPSELGGTTYEARDVVAWDGAAFSPALDGGAAGIPEGTSIDGVREEAEGSILLSFSVPTTLSGTTFSRSDVVRFDGSTGFSMAFDASAAGVPPYADVVGFGVDSAGDLVFAFDVPTRLGATNFLPGELVRWDGGSFDSYAFDPAWPPFAQIRGLGFFPPAGVVPDGASVPGIQLTVAETPTGELQLTWGVSCADSDTDYEVYEGAIGDFAGHTPVLCSTEGATTATVAASGDARYYLVVPRNAWREGSHGSNRDGAERPVGPSPCLPQLVIASCS